MSESPQTQSQQNQALSRFQIGRITEDLTCPNKFARRKAVEQVRDHGLINLISDVVSLAKSDRVEEVRVAAIGTIGELGREEHIPVVRTILSTTTNDFIQEVATRALKELQQRHQN